MEHDSSFDKQLREKITARAVINKKLTMLEADIDENFKKVYDISQEINRKNAIRRRRHKN